MQQPFNEIWSLCCLVVVYMSALTHCVSAVLVCYCRLMHLDVYLPWSLQG